MKPLEKVAIFLVIIGLEKGRKVIELMDTAEISAIVPEIRKLIEISQERQESIGAEFKQLGYKEDMHPSEILSIIRLLFNGSKIKRNS